ncbi:hypothetical protein [Pontixanthobacter aquaemixtae]|uniref:Uncharacterized protein n=1 Tax=Pontixanthobacter aquaemixtae TaxID=1958940 RepID=A0A844ZSQ5_9SPHN|nr:hypothetical protein [Pontixanthobacter aquaemixtae]MXO90036.1 hypothetical protein [Pontixanthobacter aquaemixtae]
MSLAELILSLIVAGGGGAAIAIGVVRSFGERWLDSKFAGRLQDLRHEHERQMELVKLNSSQSFDRYSRLSEQEFEATSEAWSLVTDAYVRTMSALPGFRRSDDFSRLSDDLARIVCKNYDFEEWETGELLQKAQQDRNSYFNQRRTMHEIRDAKVAIGKANSHLDRKALFLERELHRQLSEFIDWAWKAIVAWDVVREARGGGPEALDGIERHDNEFRQNAEARIKELENIVRGRFWPNAEDENALPAV